MHLFAIKTKPKPNNYVNRPNKSQPKSKRNPSKTTVSSQNSENMAEQEEEAGSVCHY